MRGAVAWILGIALAANGFVMLGVPAAWYAAVPGVAATGPFAACPELTRVRVMPTTPLASPSAWARGRPSRRAAVR